MENKAWDVAAKLLAGRDFSALEMRARLLKRGFDSDDIEIVIAKLIGLGFIVQTGNNHQLLCKMAREYFEKKDKTELTPSLVNALGAFLIRKGFEVDLVNDYLQQLAEKGL